MSSGQLAGTGRHNRQNSGLHYGYSSQSSPERERFYREVNPRVLRAIWMELSTQE